VVPEPAALYNKYEFSAASTPTRGVLNFNLCTLEVLGLVSETKVTKSAKDEEQFFI
jgi:hypothetical protein